MSQEITTATRDLVFVDTETTGLDPYEHELIEVAAVRMTFNLQTEVGRVERKCRMMRPEKASAEALKVNKYSAEEWADADPQRIALIELAALLADGEPILVAHNMPFDWGFLSYAYHVEKLALPNVRNKVCTMSIAFPLVLKGHVPKVRLETLCDLYGISNDGSHRAMTDVIRCARVYAKLCALPEPKFGAKREVIPEPAAEPRQTYAQVADAAVTAKIEAKEDPATWDL